MKKRRRKSPLENDQDSVLQDYSNSFKGARRKQSTQALHMFFSPWRIPLGLTDEEMRICALLYPLRQAGHDRLREKVTEKIRERDGVIDTPEQHLEIFSRSMPRTLPQELSPSKTMTRGRFKQGIYRFLADTTKILE
jgi:hypothetical protein